MTYIVWVAESYLPDEKHGNLLLIGSCKDYVLEHHISRHTTEDNDVAQKFVVRHEVPDYETSEAMKNMLKDLTKDYHVYGDSYVRDVPEVRQMVSAKSAEEFADVMCDWVLSQSHKIRGGDAQ